MVFKYKGLSVFAEFFFRDREPEEGPSFRSDGWHAQAGYFLKRDRLEVAARYARFDPGHAPGDDQKEIGGALNYYISKHTLKVQADFRQYRERGPRHEEPGAPHPDAGDVLDGGLDMKGKGLAASWLWSGRSRDAGRLPRPARARRRSAPTSTPPSASASRARFWWCSRETAGTVGSQSTARTDAIADVQGSVLAELHPGEFQLTHKWGHISGLAGEASLSALQKLEAHPEVEHGRAAGDEVRDLGGERAPDAGERGARARFHGEGVPVAVLDTGIDNTHPDLFDAIVAEACFCTGCQCPNGGSSQTGPGSARDDNGHGTNVSGIINSPGRVSPVGVAPDTSIVAIKVLGPNGGGDQGILSGLDAVLAKPSDQGGQHEPGRRRRFSTVCDSADASNALFGRALAALRSRGTVTSWPPATTPSPTPSAARPASTPPWPWGPSMTATWGASAGPRARTPPPRPIRSRASPTAALWWSCSPPGP